MRLNRVIRGTANYFATGFFTGRWSFQKLDSWIRMRLRCMKLKRKNYSDNGKLRVAYFRRKFGLLTLEEFCTACDAHGQARRVGLKGSTNGTPKPRWTKARISGTIKRRPVPAASRAAFPHGSD